MTHSVRDALATRTCHFSFFVSVDFFLIIFSLSDNVIEFSFIIKFILLIPLYGNIKQ